MGNSKKRRQRRIRLGVSEVQALFVDCSIVAHELGRARAERANPLVHYRIAAIEQFRAVLDIASKLFDLSTSSPRKEFEEQATVLEHALEIERALEVTAAPIDQLRQQVGRLESLTRREPETVPTAAKSVAAMLERASAEDLRAQAREFLARADELDGRGPTIVLRRYGGENGTHPGATPVLPPLHSGSPSHQIHE